MYNKTNWKNNEAPYINADKLNNIENGIKQNENNIASIASGEYYQGTFTPTGGAEYPSNPDQGFSWYISGLDDTGYTYTGGDLLGEIANNGDKIIYNGTEWSILNNVSIQDNFYVVDNINQLLTLTPLDNAIAIVSGYYEKNDKGGGIFNYDQTQTGINDGGIIIDGWVRQYTGAVDIRFFGAKGDGVEDDAVHINKLIDYINNSPITLSIAFTSGIYLINTALTVITEEVSINGGGCTLKFGIETNLSFDNPSYLTFDLVSDCEQYYFNVPNRDTLGIEAGDIFSIKSDTLWLHDNRGTLTYGELSKVAFLPTSNENVLVSLDGSAVDVIGGFSFYEEYTTVSNTQAVFYKKKTLSLENFIFDGNVTALRSLSITGYDSPIVRDLRFNSFLDTNAGISTCYAPTIDACHINTNYINYETSGTGYGFQFQSCFGGKFINGSAHNVRRGVDFSGHYPSIGGGVYASHFSNCSSSAFGSHGTAVGIIYNGNTATFCNFLAVLRGEKEIVSNNTIDECTAIVDMAYGWGQTIVNNKAKKAGAVVQIEDGVLDEKTQDQYTDAYIDTIANNTVKNAQYGLIRFSTSSVNKKINGFVIKDNYIGRIVGGSATSALTGTSGDLSGYTFGKTCVIVNNQVGSDGSYSGFFDRNVKIELDAVVNRCWHNNVSDPITANGFGGAGTAVIGSLGHNEISTRRGMIKGQISVSVTVSGGGVNQIQLNSDIFLNPYATTPASASLYVTSSGINLGEIGTAGLVTIYKNTDRSGTFTDGTYTFMIALDIHSSTSRTVMSNI